MKKLSLLLLTVSLISTFVACGTQSSNQTASPDSVAEEITEAATPSEPLTTEIAEELTSTKEYNVDGSNGSITIKASDDWTVDSYQFGSSELKNLDYGFHIHPVGDSSGYIELGYSSSFGVCGTGLVYEETEIAGVKANIGTYYDNDFWDFVIFENDIIAIPHSFSEQKWFVENKEQIMEILDTVHFESNDTQKSDTIINTDSEEILPAENYIYTVNEGQFSKYIGGKVIDEENIEDKIDDVTLTAGWKNANETEWLSQETLCGEVYSIKNVAVDIAIALKFIDKGEAITTDHYYILMNSNADLSAVKEYIIEPIS